MLDRYIQIKERMIICGQNSAGFWYCKELPANSTGELSDLINTVNSILNKFNENKKSLK